MPTKKEYEATVTLKDMQTKMYTWWWPVGSKYIVYLNIWNKKEKPTKVACRRMKYTKSQLTYKDMG
jgi:hypothetical protein